MKKKILKVIMYGILLSTSFVCAQNFNQFENSDSWENAISCVKNMKLGWNIGNSLDCTGDWIDKSNIKNFETAWGNPIITKKLIKSVKENGFNAIRIPVTYLDKMDSEGNVDKKWFFRVKEVVDYVIEENMYCIINVHHDCGGGEETWLRADKEMYENGMSKKYEYLWEQIAEYFKDYDEKLIFESFNEILDKNLTWSGSNQESYEIVNKLNQLFVDTVRNSGGNNYFRNLIVLPYSADSHVSGFRVPTDKVKNHLIAEVHIYNPSDFCNGIDKTWDLSDKKEIETIFARINEKVILEQNVPMIIGEFGSQVKFNTKKSNEERAKYAFDFVSIAKKYGITCFWWDNGTSMKIFDRSLAKPSCKPVIDAMILALE